MRFQRDREQLLPKLEPKNTSRDGEQDRRFHRNTTKPSSRGQAALVATRSRVTSCDFSHDTLDDNYVSHDDMLPDVQNYTSALDFGVDTPARTVELLLPQQASPGATLPGGASPAGISPGGVTPEGSSPPPAPTPASAAPRATNGHANRDAVGVTPAVTRSRAASRLPVPVATRYGGGHNNNRATLAEIFEAGTLQRLSELKLGEGIAHQAENASSV